MSAWASIGTQTTASRPPAGYTGGGDALVTRSVEVKALRVSWSWGAQPAQGAVTYVATITDPAGSIRDPEIIQPIPVGGYVQLLVGQGVNAHVFHGLCQSDQAVDGSGGKERALEFLDLRQYLTWDYVRCAFNLAFTKNVTVGDVTVRKRLFRHLLPANWANGLWTETDAAARM